MVAVAEEAEIGGDEEEVECHEHYQEGPRPCLCGYVLMGFRACGKFGACVYACVLIIAYEYAHL